jgi:hypothetical protein
LPVPYKSPGSNFYNKRRVGRIFVPLGNKAK